MEKSAVIIIVVLVLILLIVGIRQISISSNAAVGSSYPRYAPQITGGGCGR